MRKLILTAVLTCLLTWPLTCVTQPLVLSHNDAFDSYYDLGTKCPALVVWTLKYKDFQGNLKPTSRHFKTDTKLPPPRVKDRHLKGTGYVRGHMCPAGDRDTDKALLKQTYLTSNMVPMTMVCNSGAWKAVEDSVRTIAKTHHTVLTAAGTIFTDSIIGLYAVNSISVPAAFFRIARCTAHPQEIWIWIVQNSQSGAKPVRVGTNELQDVLHSRVNVLNLLKNLQLID